MGLQGTATIATSPSLADGDKPFFETRKKLIASDGKVAASVGLKIGIIGFLISNESRPRGLSAASAVRNALRRPAGAQAGY